MKKILLVIFSILLLSGCSDSDDKEHVKKPKKKEFSEVNFIEGEEYEKILSIKQSLEKNNESSITSSDHVIKKILFSDDERDYYYKGILTMDIEEVLQTQLKYLEVHREYMKYLYESGSTKDNLILQNRLFNAYINVYTGQQFNEKQIVKSIILKSFIKYNTEELQAIDQDKDLSLFIDEYRNWEDKIGMWKWFKKEKNANFKKDILVENQILPEKITEVEKLEIEKLLMYFDKVEKLSKNVNKKNAKSTFKVLNSLKSNVSKESFSEENKWIIERINRLVKREKTLVKLITKNKEFDASDKEFYVDIIYQEDLAFVNALKTNLNNIFLKSSK